MASDPVLPPRFSFCSPQRPVLVTGCRGQVGGALADILGPSAIAIDQGELDLSRPAEIEPKLDRLIGSRELSAVIHPAAYTQVDQAEKEPELALAINGQAPGILAQWCDKRGIPFVCYSTDYVFSGAGTRPWREDDACTPQNTYGKSKLAGESAVVRANPKAGWLILRTSWVYDSTGKNFFNSMLRLAGERDELRVVADQHGAPTYAPHLAHATLQALERATSRSQVFPSGIYHLCGQGETTWHGFAEAIFACAREQGIPLKVKRVVPIASAEFPTPALRPANSRMSQDKARDQLGVLLPDWRESLRECVVRKSAALRAAAQGAPR